MGVNYDDWPLDVYKAAPYFTLDPAATHGRRMAQARRPVDAAWQHVHSV